MNRLSSYGQIKGSFDNSFKWKQYLTWKIQCQMVLMRDGLWSIVNGSETVPADNTTDRYSKFVTRRDRSLAMIVLSIDPSLLYVIGTPEDPVVVWQLQLNQFQTKTWANRLALRRKLHSLQLKDGQPVQEHVKVMTEVFNGLPVIGDNLDDEDRVVYLLASLQESFDMLLTALEASSNVPQMETVIERLLYEKQKIKDCSTSGRTSTTEEALIVKQRRKGPQFYFCKRYGHIQHNCRERKKSQNANKMKDTPKHKINSTHTRQPVVSTSSDSD